MNLVLTPADLQSAPEGVRHWLASHLFSGETVTSETVGLVSEVVETPAETDPEEDVSVETLLEKAAAFVKEQNNDALAAILKDMGIRRVRECPPEHRAELISRMALV